jgi:hypothetical protein
MLQLTEKIFVPVSVKDELPECDSQHNLTFLSKTVAILTDEGLNATEYYTEIDSSHRLIDKGWNHQGDFNEITHWLKEETNKYVLSKEEMEQVITKAVELAREGIVVHRIPEWETEKEFDYTDSQIINEILKK